MSVRKRNEWLDVDNDEEDLESDSGQYVDRDQSRAELTSRSIKRRKLDKDLDDSASSQGDMTDEDADDVKTSQVHPPSTLNSKTGSIIDERFANLSDDDDVEDNEHTGVASKQTKHEESIDGAAMLQSKGSQKASIKSKKKRKPGVIYMSRIPPFMKPQTLRSYLSPYGDIGRLFLTPEDHGTYLRRKKSGGNKKHSFIDGWIEFLSKKDAKLAVDTLNGNIMGGKKGNYYHDDIWNLKYLTGFKWDDLTEQISRENKERESRLRTEITKAKRENENFVRDIERGKILDTMKTRKEERGQAKTDEKTADTRKTFRQNQAKNMRADQKSTNSRDDSTKRVLSKLL